MSNKEIFCLLLCSTILSPAHGMELNKLDEGNQEQRIATKSPLRTTAKFPAELAYEELCQIFSLSNSNHAREDNKVETADGFLVSHKVLSSQEVKIKGFLLRAKERGIVAVGELDYTLGEAYTMGPGYQSLFAKYQLYKGDDLVPNYCFSATVAKKNTTQVSPKTSSTLTENLISPKKSSKKSSHSKKDTPRGFEQENHYLDFVVDLLLDIKMPDTYKPKACERAELLAYSYPAFTSEKNLFSLLNIFKEAYPQEKDLEEIICFVKSTKEITNEEEYSQILSLIKSKKFSPIDGMNLNNLNFMNALLRRDVSLSRIHLSDFSRPESELWKNILRQASETSNWIALQYLSLPTKEERGAFFDKMYDLYNSLIENGNIHGAWQIATGLQQAALSRVIDQDKKLTQELQKGVSSDIVRREKMLNDLQCFTDSRDNFKSYHNKESSFLNKNSSYVPSLFIVNHDIDLNSEFCKKELFVDSNNLNKIQRRLFLVQEVARLLKMASSYQNLPSSDSNDTYLNAVCNFKIHPEALEVYSDLLYEWPIARKVWSDLEPKTLEDWTPGYFAHLLRMNGCAHAIEICFKNNVCDGKDIIHKSKMKKEKLVALGGIRGLSDEMIKMIMSAPRKTEEKNSRIRSNSKKVEKQINIITLDQRKTDGNNIEKISSDASMVEISMADEVVSVKANALHDNTHNKEENQMGKSDDPVIAL